MDNKYSSLQALIKMQYPNIVGLVVQKEDQVSYEYFNQGSNRNSYVHIASVTKSIVSALFGIAIEQGAIRSIDDRVLKYFSRYKLKRGEHTIKSITIRDVMTMTAPYKFRSEPDTRVYSSDDWTKAALDLLGGKQSVGDFKYNTVGLQVLSGIITNATGQPILDFANEYLFSPLEITLPRSVNILNKTDYLSFIKNTHSIGWVCDPQGQHTAGWGLTLRTSDMAKIGQLYLNKGVWQNKQLLTDNWITQSTRKQSATSTRAYGLLWWVLDDRSYAAIGDSGNIIYISPSKRLVVTIACEFKSNAKDSLTLIKEHIEPLIKSM